ncbi:MAG: DUF3261 domain-containing protein [Myxococcales bacterium]|nr:DUF3261 domain-containing protein [Myxococcales bacterium]
MTRPRLLGAAVVLGILAWFALIVPRLVITTDITRFMPSPSGGEAAARSAVVLAAMRHSDAAQRLIIDVSLTSPPPDEAAAVDLLHAITAQLQLQLQRSPLVRLVSSGVTTAEQDAIVEYLRAQPPWMYLAAEAYAPPEIDRRLRALSAKLAGAESAMHAALAPADPLGSMTDALQALHAAQASTLGSYEGLLVTADQRHAFLFVTTYASAFDAPAQRELVAQLRAWELAHPAVTLMLAGAAPYAIASEAQIKRDISRIGLVSTLGILLLFLLLFRDLRLLALALLPLGVGCAAGVLACHYSFGSIHGITIAFGTSLLGVGIDYVEHFYAHVALSPGHSARAAMASVWRSLLMGGISTVLGFAGLYFSGVAGLREMGVFAAAAIAASLLVTIVVVPAWMPAAYRPPRAAAWLHGWARRLLMVVGRLPWSRGARGLLIAGCLGIASLGAVSARFTDDVALLSAANGPHRDADLAVRARLADGAGDDQALAALMPAGAGGVAAQLETVTSALAGARALGLVDGFLDVSRFVPSDEQQQVRHQSAVESVPVVKSKLLELEFSVEAFAPYFAALAAPPAWLAYADFVRSPLGQQWVQSGVLRRDLVILPLRGVRDLAALRAHVEARAPAVITKPDHEIRTVFAAARGKIITASLLGALAIFGLLWARYRRLAKALAALLPAVIAIAATVGMLAAMGIALHILHLLALLLVLAMATDFGVFLVDKAADVDEAATSLVSMLVAALTTILSFGLLGFSENHGMAALGYTVALGISLALLLCPLIMVALRMPLVTVVLATALALGACHRAPPSRMVIAVDDAAYPYKLKAPADLHPDLAASQTIEVRSLGDAAGAPQAFNAMLQKHRETLLVVGVGPMNTRAFTIEQSATQVVYERYMGPPMRISPRGVIVDIQRVFYARVPRTSGACDGELAADVGDERVVESWRDGDLVRRTFTRAGYAEPIAVEFVYATPSGGPALCRDGTDAARVTLRNPWFGYELAIENRSMERL